MNKRSLFCLSALMALGLASTLGVAVAQTAKINKAQLVGSWVLVANSNTTPSTTSQ
jgi:hypothetical protein